MASRRIRIAIAVLGMTIPGVGFAGAVLDTDADLVPNQFDNCSTFANGPNQTTNQVDVDLDGYGNRCDADYDQNGATTVGDFGIFLRCFAQPIIFETDCRATDHDGNQVVSGADFGVFLAKFQAAGTPNTPGPSGLACADPTIRIDLGQVGCLP